ncbi:hypothetical protein GCM10010532_097860 [Dactylosporangium siamense]|uniref:Uncharacterized protein n=1 Tax=Dactylosporangium siamense TaxID=685454 RepID=A0A919UI88_9ACTN|nr:hypothetical protein Dsi01nite_111970 [Dactylosporangium siamense]
MGSSSVDSAIADEPTSCANPPLQKFIRDLAQADSQRRRDSQRPTTVEVQGATNTPDNAWMVEVLCSGNREWCRLT